MVQLCKNIFKATNKKIKNTNSGFRVKIRNAVAIKDGDEFATEFKLEKRAEQYKIYKETG